MRKLGTGAIGSIAVLALAGAVTPLSAQEPVTISYLTHWGPDQVAQLQAVADAFQQANPGIKVEIRSVPFGDLLTTIKTQAASPGGPTIAGIYNLWLPELVKDGVAVAAPDAQKSDITTNWGAGAVGGASVDGTVYGYPNEINTYALDYNNGCSRRPASPHRRRPGTSSSHAKALTKKDGDVITQQGLGLINSWAAGVVHPFYSLVASDCGDIVDGTKPTLDSGASAAVMNLYEQLIKDGVTSPEMGTADANTAGPFMDNFSSGNTAMIIMANWWQGSIKAAMGDAFSDIATAPIPVGPDCDASHPVSYEWLTMVNGKATPEQQDAAWKFLQFLDGTESGTTGSGMGEILIGMGIIPSRTSDSTAFADKLSDPFLKTYVDSLASAVPFPMILGGQELSEMLQKKIEGIEFGELSAADAASQAQSEAQTILSQYYP